jgi:anti-sigma regulatory factor (Ser/Thr protein kinase)
MADSGVLVVMGFQAFSGEVRQVRAVRHWIETLLPDCEARDSLILIASELAANSVEHTRSGEPGGHFTVHLACSSDSVRLTVGDQGSPRPPQAVAAALDSEHGRGLFMVDGLAADWGCTDTPEGRSLWADVSWNDNPLTWPEAEESVPAGFEHTPPASGAGRLSSWL